ncbi:single-stranded DNA-binding protein [Gardnerella vaginalis]|uniref:single-stranded DNA-binding protein n=1 Tax=Gardnerella TaxID=2701 RepID=UPI00035387D6|nr:single-stranded DNA-binding protein [Gardnerella vaginalis]EPI54018.1 single-strand binding family protein [Gardnerella vaginalis JCP7275]KMT45940.1 single-stranded DNA-binding protein [Gardnerella vaginalis]
MAGETVITVIGNLAKEPETATSSNGSVRTSFTIVSNSSTFDRRTNSYINGTPLSLRCVAWGDLAEHCAQTLTKGMRVIVQGRLRANNYVDKNSNEKRYSIDLMIDEIGPSLRFATAQVNRLSSKGGFAGNNNGFNHGSDFGGYSGGANANAAASGYTGGYAGGANYANNAVSAAGINSGSPMQNASKQGVNVEDPWSASAPSNDGFATFGATSDFGGTDEEPEF